MVSIRAPGATERIITAPVRNLEPREKRVVAAAFAAALVFSLAWTVWLGHLGLERGRVTPPRLVLAFLVFGAHYLGAVIVILKRPFDPANRALFPFLTLLGVLNAGRIIGAVTFGTSLEDQVAFAGSATVYFVALGWILVTIGGFFPVTRLASPGRAYLVVTVLSVVPLGLYLRRWWMEGGGAPPGGAWKTGIAVFALAVNLFIFVYFLSLAWVARREDVRRRARVVLVAVIIYIGLYIFLRDIPAVAGAAPLLPVWALSSVSVLFPLALIVAATRFHLFEVDRLIRRSASYAIASVALVVLLLAGVPALTAIVALVSPALQGTLTTALVAVVLFLVFDPLRKRAQVVLDRKFRQGAYDPAQLVTEVVGDLRDAGEDLAADVLHRIAAAHRPDRQAFWVFALETQGVPVRPVTTGALADVPELDRTAVLPMSDPAESRNTFHPLTADGGDPPYAEGELANTLRAAGFAAAMPLFSGDGEPLGLIALGAKRTGEGYVPEERKILGTVAGHVALALERAALTRQVDEDRRVREKVLGHLQDGGGGALYECELCGRVAGEDDVVCPADGHAVRMTQAVPRLLAGRYRLDRRLGEGGMGTVYAARDIRGNRDCAVKVIRAEQLSDRTSLARFRREARLTARLGHPNAVAVYDYGELRPGGAFLVMELLSGGSLRTELTLQKPVPFLETAWVLDRTLDVLAAAHAAGLVHRDLKPDNLFLTRGPGGATRLKLLDFGLARETKADARPESGGAISSVSILMGTPGYIAPEIIAGAEATPGSDQWAIAATGFELLTGVRLKFDRPDLPLRSLVEEVLSIVGTVASGVPATYARSLAKAMAVDPEDRWVSVVALRRALDRSTGGRIPGDGDVRFEVLRDDRR
ncbi:MAG: protein kinase [Holophagales bacterium]|nr:protein kinase [Holophagales bacterium]